MNRKNREREAGWIQATVEAEADAVAQRARADFLLAAHRDRTNEALRLPPAMTAFSASADPYVCYAAVCDDCGRVSPWADEERHAHGAADQHSHRTGHSVSVQRAA